MLLIYVRSHCMLSSMQRFNLISPCPIENPRIETKAKRIVLQRQTFSGPSMAATISFASSRIKSASRRFVSGSSDSSAGASVETFAKRRFIEERRLARLYGSNTKRASSIVVRQRKKLNSGTALPGNAKTAEIDNSLSNRRMAFVTGSKDAKMASKSFESPLTRVEKEGNGSLPRTRLRKNASTSQKCLQDGPKQAWFVGYQNAATLPAGSPSAIASRYGPDGAFLLRIQYSDRVSRSGGELERAKGGALGESSLSSFGRNFADEWAQPLIASPHGVTCGRLGGGGHFASTPKMWAECGASYAVAARGGMHYGDPPSLPSKLERMAERDSKQWADIAGGAREERRKAAARRENWNCRAHEISTAPARRPRQRRNNPQSKRIISLR